MKLVTFTTGLELMTKTKLPSFNNNLTSGVQPEITTILIERSSSLVGYTGKYSSNLKGGLNRYSL
jgi:hypothetical protein